MKHYTNYNELMHKALRISVERGVSEQAEFVKIVHEVFAADAKRRREQGEE